VSGKAAPYEQTQEGCSRNKDRHRQTWDICLRSK